VVPNEVDFVHTVVVVEEVIQLAVEQQTAVVVVVSPDEIQNTPFVDPDSEYRRDGRHVECSVDRPVAVDEVVDTSLAAVVVVDRLVVDRLVVVAGVDTSLVCCCCGC
jgi:hypothetical protein